MPRTIKSQVKDDTQNQAEDKNSESSRHAAFTRLKLYQRQAYQWALWPQLLILLACLVVLFQAHYLSYSILFGVSCFAFVAGIVACYKLNLAMNLASEWPDFSFRFFKPVLTCLAALVFSGFLIQGASRLSGFSPSHQLEVRVKNTSAMTIEKLTVKYGLQEKLLPKLAPLEVQVFHFNKVGNTVMSAYTADQEKQGQAEFAVDYYSDSVFLRIDWQGNILPEMR